MKLTRILYKYRWYEYGERSGQDETYKKDGIQETTTSTVRLVVLLLTIVSSSSSSHIVYSHFFQTCRYEKQRVVNAELREEKKRQRDRARLREKAKQRLRYLKYLDGTQKAQFRPEGKRSLYSILSNHV